MVGGIFGRNWFGASGKPRNEPPKQPPKELQAGIEAEAEPGPRVAPKGRSAAAGHANRFVRRLARKMAPTSWSASASFLGYTVGKDLQAAPKKTQQSPSLVQAGKLLTPGNAIDDMLRGQRAELAVAAAALVDQLTGAHRASRDGGGTGKSAALAVAERLGFGLGLTRGPDPCGRAMASQLLSDVGKMRQSGKQTAMSQASRPEDPISVAVRATAALSQISSRDELLQWLEDSSAAAAVPGIPLDESVRRANEAIESSCRRWTTTFVQQQILGNAGGALAERLKAAAAQVEQRLHTGQPAVDAGYLEMLVLVGLRGTQPGSAERADALEALVGAKAASLVQATAQDMKRPHSAAAVAAGSPPAVPQADGYAALFRLTDQLIEHDGAIHLIQRLTGGQSAERKSLRVALLAGRAYREAGRTGRLTAAQAVWLRRAVAQAEVNLQLRSASTDGETANKQRVAFHGVEMGYYATDPGSRHACMNALLWAQRDAAKFSGIARRNIRAGTVVGDAINTLDAAKAGGSNMPWRKSAIGRLVAELQATGKMPSRAVALQSLHATSADLRDALQTYADAKQGSPVEQLLLGVLRESGLGEDGSQPGSPRSLAAVPEEKPLTRLRPDFFKRAGLQVDLSALPQALQDEWRVLSCSKPNIGHVLSLLRRHVGVCHVLSGEKSQARSLSDERLERESAARQTVQAYGHVAHAFRDLLRDAGPQAQAAGVADLLEAAADVFAGVKPAANCLTLGLDHYGLVEGKVADLHKARLKHQGASDAELAGMAGPQALDAARQLWPQDLRETWDRFKSDDVNVGRVLAEIGKAAAHHVRDEAAQPGKGPEAQGPATQFHDALRSAAMQADRLERHVRAEDFRLAACDTVTVFHDARNAVHAQDMLWSFSKRVNLGDSHSLRHGRFVAFNPFAGLGILVRPFLPVSPILSRNFMGIRTLAFSSHGAGLEVLQTAGKVYSGRYGVSAGLELTDGGGNPAHGDSERSGSDFGAGVSGRLTGGEEVSRANGVLIRALRGPDRDEEMRHLLFEALDQAYRAPDPMSALLLQPGIVVTPVDVHSVTGGVLHSGGGRLSVKMGLSDNPAQRERQRKGAGLMVDAGPVFRSSHSNTVRREPGNQGPRVEQVVASNINGFGGGFRAALRASLLPVSRHTAPVRLHAPLISLEGGIEYSSTREQTLRWSTMDGEVGAATQIVTTYERFEELKKDLPGYLPSILKRMVDEDPFKSDPASVRAQRSRARAEAAFADYEKHDGPNTTYVVMANALPVVSHRAGQLKAIAQSLVLEGRSQDAERYLQSAEELLNDPMSWSAMNAREQARGKSGSGRSAGIVLVAAGTDIRATSTGMSAAVPSAHRLGWRSGGWLPKALRERLHYRRGPLQPPGGGPDAKVQP